MSSGLRNAQLGVTPGDVLQFIVSLEEKGVEFCPMAPDVLVKADEYMLTARDRAMSKLADSVPTTLSPGDKWRRSAVGDARSHRHDPCRVHFFFPALIPQRRSIFPASFLKDRKPLPDENRRSVAAEVEHRPRA